MRLLSVHIKHLFLIAVLTATSIFYLHGCSRQAETGTLPDVLRVGLLPDEGEEVLLRRYTPLFDYLSRELDISYELKLSSSYEDLLKQFENSQIDLAYFGGLTFIQALHKSNAVPLVMRDIDVRFTSYFITRSNMQLTRIEEFKGKSFAYGSNLSTSGHLMPRFFLNEKKITPELFFGEVVYSGSHDKTAYLVRDGIVEIGVANSKIIDKMIMDGRLNSNDLHIIWETPPYTDYVWAIQSAIGRAARTKIRNVFLSLSPEREDHARILMGMDAGGFLPASPADFSRLEKIAQQTGLLGEKSK